MSGSSIRNQQSVPFVRAPRTGERELFRIGHEKYEEREYQEHKRTTRHFVKLSLAEIAWVHADVGFWRSWESIVGVLCIETFE